MINPYQEYPGVLLPTVEQAGRVPSQFLWSGHSLNALGDSIFLFSPCLLYSFITDNKCPLTAFLETYGRPVKTYTLKFNQEIIRGIKNITPHSEKLSRCLLGIEWEHVVPLAQWLDDMIFLDVTNHFIFRTETDVVKVEQPGDFYGRHIGVINIRTREKYYRHIAPPAGRGTSFLSVVPTNNDDVLFKQLCDEARKGNDEDPVAWHVRARTILIEKSAKQPNIVVSEKPLTRAQITSWIEFYRRIVGYT